MDFTYVFISPMNNVSIMMRSSNVLRGTAHRSRCITSSSSSFSNSFYQWTEFNFQEYNRKRFNSASAVALARSNPLYLDPKSIGGHGYCHSRDLLIWKYYDDNIFPKNTTKISRMLSTASVESISTKNEKQIYLEDLEKKANTIQEWFEIIKGYAELGELVRAEEIILRQQSIAFKSDNDLINAWHILNVNGCQQRDLLPRGIPQRAQSRLEAMEYNNSAKGNDDHLSIETYNRVIETWGVSDEHYFASMAQNIFDRLAKLDPKEKKITQKTLGIQPNAETYRIMLRTWCRSPQRGAAFNAMGFLMKMQALLEESVKEMEPSLEDYLFLLQAWSRADDKYAARRAQAVLRKMDNLNKDGHTEVKPNTDCFKHVFIAMANSNLAEMGVLADKLMKQMVNEFFLQPDVDCFSAIIETWSNVARISETDIAQKEAATKAEEWLVKMERMYQQSSSTIIKTGTKNYNTVIHAWSACRNVQIAAKNAEKLLNQMEQAAVGGDMLRKPDRNSYLYTVRAYANSNRKDQAQKAVELLERMLQQYQSGNESCEPTTEFYHAVIDACGKCKVRNNEEERNSALRLAIETIHKMKGNSPTCEINAFTYKLLLQTIGNLLFDGKYKTKSLISVFESCCTAGLVDNDVVQQFQEVAPDDVYHKIVLLPSNGGRNLPDAWTRNLGKLNPSHNGSKMSVFSSDGSFLAIPGSSEYKMRTLRNKTNQKLLRGGRSK